MNMNTQTIPAYALLQDEELQQVTGGGSANDWGGTPTP